MANLPHEATIGNPPKEAVISFRCHPNFKKAVDKGLVDLEMTLQEAGIRAFADYFEIPIPVAGQPYPPPGNGGKSPSVADWIKRKRQQKDAE